LDKTTVGYKAAKETVLALNRDYPANKSHLSGKQGFPVSYKTPVEISDLKDKYTNELDWNANWVKSCVHCHQIGGAFRSSYHDKKDAIPTSLIHPWPGPKPLGFSPSADPVAGINPVELGSISATARLEPGAAFLSMDGLHPVSFADVSWALSRAPDTGSLNAVVRQGNETKKYYFSLPADWRRKSDLLRRVGTRPLRGMASGGLCRKTSGTTIATPSPSSLKPRLSAPEAWANAANTPQPKMPAS